MVYRFIGVAERSCELVDIMVKIVARAPSVETVQVAEAFV